MKNLIQAAVFTLFAASTVQAQQAVQWKVSDGGNGHWYQFVRVNGTVTWPEARIACQSRGGELAIVDSAPLTEFLNAYYPSGVDACFIGCQQLVGVWRWVNGQTASWTNWCPCGQPSGDGPVVELWGGGVWNDISTTQPRQGYLIEWSADCNNDGAVDYGQILYGQFTDMNGNGVLDCCESGSTCCAGDILLDGVVNGADLGALLSYWGPVTSSPVSRACDLNADGRVDGSDLGMLLANWGTCH